MGRRTQHHCYGKIIYYSTHQNIDNHSESVHTCELQQLRQKMKKVKGNMNVKCPVCQVQFCQAKNFNRHFREQHGQQLKEENETYQCWKCELQFKRKEHLSTHINSVHEVGVKLECSSCSFTTLNKHSLVRHFRHLHNNIHPAKEIREREISNKIRLKAGADYFPCSYCPKKFKQKHALMTHLRTKHNCDIPNLNIKKVCPLCFFETIGPVSKALEDMYNHFLETHGLAMNTKTLDFKDMSEFVVWKTDLEIETSSKFIRSNRHAKSHLRYACHRSGNFQSKGFGKRNLKKNGSCKINGFCPASIVADVLNDGKVQVRYLSTHVGHTNDLKHILLSSDERKEIASKIVNNVPCEQILGEIRGNITSCDMKRIHLTTRKDILNIKKSALIETLKNSSECVIDSQKVVDNVLPEDISEGNDTVIVASTCKNNVQDEGLFKSINNNVNNGAQWSNEENVTENKSSDLVLRCSPGSPDPIVICLEIPTENLIQRPGFESTKDSFIVKLSDMLRDKITNFEELQAVQEHCNPISLILDSMKTLDNANMVAISSVPHPQQITFTVTDGKGYISTIRTTTTGSSQIIDTITSDEKDMFAIQLV